MNAQYLTSFQRDFSQLPLSVREKFHQQLKILLEQGMTHPDLNVRKRGRHDGIWEAHIGLSYHFTFQTVGEIFLLRRIGTRELYPNF